MLRSKPPKQNKVIKGTVMKLNLDAAFEQKNDIDNAVEELEKGMSHYEYEIVQTLKVDIEPDEHVKKAMNEINAGDLAEIRGKRSVEKFTTKIQNLESEMEAKVTRKLQGNMTWLLKKLRERRGKSWHET